MEDKDSISISTGHSEISTSEQTGWGNEESKTNTINEYSFRKSTQINTYEQSTYYDTIETSVQNTYEWSNIKSNSVSTKTISIIIYIIIIYQ
ncbi:hypothetical protein BCR32DRAFT_286733 [Anaeromyces robustus]|uniref:Uncharacterized protein n=1 Tax=Anaeromyces robustus TaxID=1754192 RepID=A0A1Y1VUL7_9FUNG|nr:hypothetical protein BCR32DRAFT_286733 [Anaeromyces robustus]|eukprot:ORX64981.1 hypothetical protein BCR32DRAFT_286733 [Anaeromyces robustus]